MHRAAQFRRHLRGDQDLLGHGVPDHDLGQLRAGDRGRRPAGRRPRILVELEFARLRRENRLARVVGRQHLHVVVAFQAAGLRTPRPIRENRRERLDLHYLPVAFRHQKSRFRPPRRGHRLQLHTPVGGLVRRDRLSVQATQVGGKRHQIIGVGIELNHDDAHLRIGIKLFLNVHRRWAVLQTRSHAPFGHIPVAHPAGDPLEVERPALLAQRRDVVLGVCAGYRQKRKVETQAAMAVVHDGALILDVIAGGKTRQPTLRRTFDDRHVVPDP